MRLRYRLATRLLGYPPMQRPDNGAHIVIVDGVSLAMIGASSIKIDITSKMPTFQPGSYTMASRGGSSGTFSGTIGQRSDE